MRAKKTFILSNNDDDQKNDKVSIDNIISLLINEQNNDLKESISKEDFY